MSDGILQGRGVRKAFASRGDDTTLSRFVKVKADDQEAHKIPRRQWQLPGTVKPNAAIDQAHSLYYRRGVKPVADVTNVLVSGHSNVKIGRDVRKGKLFRGYWIYTLTLEERATCPSTCQHWISCYGNNMPFAKRVKHGPELIAALEQEIPKLLATRGRPGILIRLHALGDFYAPQYVRFWERMLAIYPNLAVFGYTARRDDAIYDAIRSVKAKFGRRFAIRFSDGKLFTDCTVSIKTASQKPADAFLCPEQTGATSACATCGLCWNSTRNVAFMEH